MASRLQQHYRTALDEAEPPRAQQRWRLLSLAVAAGGVAVSFLLFWLLVAREQQLAKARFQADSQTRVEAIQEVISNQINEIRSLEAFFAGSELVERKEFRAFVRSSFEQHVGVQALGWAPRVSIVQRSAYEKKLRDEGFPKFQITEHGESGETASAGRRAEYYPAVFVEPFEKNQSLFGFDLFSKPACREAMRRARKSGRPAAATCTPSDEGKTQDILLFVAAPVWNDMSHPEHRSAESAESDSYVFGIFQLESILQAAVDKLPDIGIDISIGAPSAIRAETIIYTWHSALRSQPATTATPPSKGLYFAGKLDVGDCRWTLYCVPVEKYLARYRTWGPAAMLAAGLLATGLLLAYLFILAGRTVRVEQLVAQRTRELRESEHRFRSVIDNAADGFFLSDREGERFIDVNQHACDNLGYSREELLTMGVADIDIEFIPENLVQYLHLPDEKYPLTIEGVHRRKDGTTFPVELRLAPVLVGGQSLMLALARDITERKRAEEMLLNDQRLLRDLLDLHEQERKLVSYEIHDGLAQMMTGALYKFQAIEPARSRDPEMANALFEDAIRLLREAIAEARRLISGLRPPILDESGVIAAVEYLISECQQNGGPIVEFFHPDQWQRMPSPLETAVFRTVQECLTNACRYSKSEKVRVELKTIDDRVLIDVEDNGVGFEPKKVGSGHYGLRGIRERARLLGGVAAIESSPGRGTRIHVEFPLFTSSENGPVESEPEPAES